MAKQRHKRYAFANRSGDYGRIKSTGLRFYKSGYDIKGRQEKWPEFIEERLGWALKMRELIDELGF